MSDGHIRLIPTDPLWQPSPEDASAAATFMASLFTGSGDTVEQIDPVFYDRVTLIDAGEYTVTITCSHCGGDIALDWLGDVVRTNGGVHFDHLDVVVPCCGAWVGLDTLRFDEPIGFARFEIAAMNPVRAQYDLTTAELDQVAGLLGHPVVQIIAHY
jgi:hypothetical protein